MENIQELIDQKKATIIDVRTPKEFIAAHLEGSINIPLMDIPNKLEEIRVLENIVLCCASGGRSAQAEDYLKVNGIECHNMGSWQNLIN
jgi:phage shock protein E